MSRLLFSGEINKHISSLAQATQKSITIHSAFIKTNALEWLSESIADDIEVEIIGRWKPDDLVANVSDLSAYKFCKDRGWKFGIDQELHSKVFIFDQEQVILGSANLTNRGLSLSKEGNLELGTLVEPGPVDMKRLNSYMDNIFWMDDEKFQKFSDFVTSCEKPKKNLSWPEELINLISKPIKH